MNNTIKINILLSSIFLIFALFISSCANKAGEKDAKYINPVFCNVDSDCKIKDVHNCCGYYPKCVNKEHVPDIEAVERECREKGMASVCGFPEIKSCTCIEHECKGVE